MESFEPRRVGALQAYLRQAVLNRLRDELRRHARRPDHIGLDEVDAEIGDSPLERAIGRETVESLRARARSDCGPRSARRSLRESRSG